MRALFLICGLLCVGLAALGVVLPLLPTTPFLLLALWLFARSSKHLEHWLISNRLFGSYLDNYRRGLGVPLQVKVATLALLWTTLALTAVFAVDRWWIRGLLLAVAMGVTIHISMLKTCPKR